VSRQQLHGSVRSEFALFFFFFFLASWPQAILKPAAIALFMCFISEEAEIIDITSDSH
jgi:hypothetical protein